MTNGGRERTESEEVVGEEEETTEGQREARRVDEDDPAQETGGAKGQGRLAKENLDKPTTTLGAVTREMEKEEADGVEDTTNHERFEMCRQLIGPVTLSSTTIKPKEKDEDEMVGVLRNSSVSSTEKVLPGGMRETPPGRRDSLVQSGPLAASRTSKSVGGAKQHQSQERRRQDVWQQGRQQLERGHVQREENLVRQHKAETPQEKALHPEMEDVEVGTRRVSTKERRYEAKRGRRLLCKEGTRKRQTPSCQLVNFSGRLLRFERGSPLSPLEAFDEFLLTFELQHLKPRLLACLRQRGCCCSRAVRGEAISTAVHAKEPWPRVLRRRRMIGTEPMVVAAAAATRQETSGAQATAEPSSDTENMPSISTDSVGGVRPGPRTMEADEVTVPEVIWKREGYHHWISRIRRDKVFPIQAAALRSSENCTSTLEGGVGLGETPSAVLTTDRNSGFCGAEGVSTCRVNSQSGSATLEDSREIVGNLADQGGMQDEEEDNRNQSDGERNGALRRFFRRGDKVANERSASMSSVRIRWGKRGGLPVAAGVGREEPRKAERDTHTAPKRSKGSWQLAGENSHYRICSSCEANPLRWLWRTGPLSLLYEEANNADLRGTREAAGDGRPSTAARGVGIKDTGAADGAGGVSRGMLVATGAWGAYEREAGTSSARNMQRRSLLLPGTSRNPIVEGLSCSQQNPDKRPMPARLLLSPDEADRWRMACVELPRHFLPVSKKSRPLTIHDETTGTKLGEVRWSGCLLVSQRQDQVGLDKSEKAFPCATAETSAMTTAAAVQSQQQTSRLPAGAAEQRKQRSQSPDEKSCVGQLHQEQRQAHEDHIVTASIRCDPCHLTPEGLDDERDACVEFSENTLRGSNVVQPEDLATQKGVLAKGSCAHAKKNSAASVETLSTARISKRSDFSEERMSRPPGGKTETRAASGEAARNTVNPPDCLESFDPVAFSANNSVNNLLNLGDKTETQMNVHSATQTSGISCPGGPPSVQLTYHGGGGLHSESYFKEEGVKTGSTCGTVSFSSSGPRSQGSGLEPDWNSGVDPLQDCDCWLLSSGLTQRRDRRPRAAPLAFSSLAPRDGAGEAAASCTIGKNSLRSNCTATPARAAVRAAVGGTTEVAADLKEARATPGTASSTRTGIAAIGAQTSKGSTAALAAGASGAAAARSSATPVATPSAQTRAYAGMLRKTERQEQQERMGENFTHGDDAPVEAVAQRLRTSSTSLLLQGRLSKKTVCRITRTMPYDRNISSFTEARTSRQTQFSFATNTEAAAAGGRGELVGIRWPASKAEETSKKSQQHDTAERQLQCFWDALAGERTYPSDGRRCETDGSQRAETYESKFEFTKKPFSFSFLPSLSCAVTDTGAETPQRHSSPQKSRRRWSIGIDDLLRWTSTTRHSSNSFQKSNSICCTGTISSTNLPEVKNAFCPSCHKGSAPLVASVFTGTTSAASSLCSSKTGSGRESISTRFGRDMPPDTSAPAQDCSTLMRTGQLKAAAGLPSYLSSCRWSPYSSSRTTSLCRFNSVDQDGQNFHPSSRMKSVQRNNAPHATAGEPDVTLASQAEVRSSEQDARPRATAGRSLAMAAAAPVIAVMKSAAAAVASVAPAILSTGAVSASHTASSPIGHTKSVASTCAAVVSATADLSLTMLNSSSFAVPPVSCPSRQGVVLRKECGPLSFLSASSVRDNASAACAHAAVADGTRGIPCRAAADSFPTGGARTGTTASAIAGTVVEGSTASLRPAVPGVTCDMYSPYTASHIGRNGAHAGFAESPAPRALFTLSSATSSPGASTSLYEPTTVCQYPVVASAPAVGTAVAGVIRSSSWRRRNSFYRRERSTRHLPLLAPSGAASCFGSSPFPFERITPHCDASVGRVTATIPAGQQQKQNLQGVSSPDFGDMRLATTEAASGENEARLAGAARLVASTSASTAVEPTAHRADIHSTPSGREHAPRTLNVEEHLEERFLIQQSPLTEIVRVVATGENGSPAYELQRNRNEAQLFGHPAAEGASPAVKGQQIYSYTRDKETGRIPHCDELTGIPLVGKEVLSTSSIVVRKGSIRESQRRVRLGGNVLAEVDSEATSLAEDRNVSISSPHMLRTPASNNLAGPEHHLGGDDKRCDTYAQPSHSAEEKSCDVLTTGPLQAPNLFSALQEPVVKDGCMLEDQRERLEENVKIPCSYERGDSAAVFDEDHGRVPFPRHPRSGSQAATHAAARSCSGNLVQHAGTRTHDMLTQEEEHSGASPQTSLIQRATADSALAGCSADQSTDVEVLPIIQTSRDDKLFYFCTVKGQVGEAGGRVTQCRGGLSPTAPNMIPGKDLQEDWLTKLPLVHEARHCTSPDILSSDSSSEWSSVGENEEQIELAKRFSVSSSPSDVSAVKTDEPVGEAQIEGDLMDAIPLRQGSGYRHAPVSFSEIPRSAADPVSATCADVQQSRCACGASPDPYAFEGEKIAHRVTGSQGARNFHEQEIPEEQLSQPLTDAHTALSTGPPVHVCADGAVRVTERVCPVKYGSLAADNFSFCGVDATARSSRKVQEETSMRVDQQESSITAGRDRADAKNLAVRGEPGLQSKTQSGDVSRMTCSTAGNVFDCRTESRAQQSQRLRDKYDAEKETADSADRDLRSDSSASSDSSVSSDSGYRSCVRRTLPSPSRADGPEPAGGTPKAKGELKRLLFSLGNGLKAKMPPTLPLQGRVEDGEEKLQPCLLQKGEAASMSAAGDSSRVTFFHDNNNNNNNKELEKAEVSVQTPTQSGSNLRAQHRLKGSAVSAAQVVEEDADTNRSQHCERASGRRKFFSFAARPSTPSAKQLRADDGRSASPHEPVCSIGSQWSPPSAVPDRLESYQLLAPVTEDIFNNATRVDISALVCWKGDATLESSALCERALPLERKENIQEDDRGLSCKGVAEVRQHAETRGHSAGATNATEDVSGEGDVANVPSVNLRASSSQGQARSGVTNDNLIRSDRGHETEARRASAADGMDGNPDERQQPSGRQPCEAKRGWAKRTEGRRTGAWSTLQLAAAAQYVSTRNKVAAKLIRKQLSVGREEVSSGVSLEETLVSGRASSADDDTLAKRRGGRMRLFSYKKCAEEKKVDEAQGGEENSNACSETRQSSEKSYSGSSSGGSGSGNEAQRENQEHSISNVTHVLVREYDHSQKERGGQAQGDCNDDVVKRTTRIYKCSRYLSSAKRSVDGEELKEAVLKKSETSEGSAPAGRLEFAQGREGACTDLRAAQEKELQLLLQAQAYLLRQVSRRQGLPEVIIPASVNDEQPVFEVARLVGQNKDGPLGRTGCRGEVVAFCEGKNIGPALSGRTIKPCYAHSAATARRLGTVQERMTRSVPFLSSTPEQRTPCEDLQGRKGSSGGATAFQNSTQPLQGSPTLNENDGGLAAIDVFGTARDKCSKRVLCVYASGKFQLLLAEPEDEDETGAFESTAATAAASAAGDAVGTDHNNISSGNWRTCSCWVRLNAGRHYRLRPDDVLRVGPFLEFSLKRFLTGVSSQQGYRLSMEDEEVVIQDLGVAEDVYCSYFAVYDGHGGRACAEFVKRVLHVTFRRELLRMCGGSLSMSSTVRQHVYQALLKSFLATDAAFLCEQQRRKRSGLLSTSGCACVVVVILGGEVWCANCGDARAVLCRAGKALELSSDHKPHRKDELQRIVAAGGFVRSKRVLGRLAVSRAFGDVDYKGTRAHAGSTPLPAPILSRCGSTNAPIVQSSSYTAHACRTPNASNGTPPNSPLLVSDVPGALVTAVPEIRMQPLCKEDEFLLLACDGLFDVFTSQEATDFVKEALNGKFADFRDPQVLVDALLYEAIEKRKSRDNVTAILVLLSPSGRTFAVASGGTRPRE